MTEAALPPPPPPGWVARFGYRNVAYVAFVMLLVPAGVALEA